MNYLKIICKQNRAIILAKDLDDMYSKLFDVKKWPNFLWCVRLAGESKETFILRACAELKIKDKRSFKFLMTEPWD